MKHKIIAGAIKTLFFRYRPFIILALFFIALLLFTLAQIVTQSLGKALFAILFFRSLRHDMNSRLISPRFSNSATIVEPGLATTTSAIKPVDTQSLAFRVILRALR